MHMMARAGFRCCPMIAHNLHLWLIVPHLTAKTGQSRTKSLVAALLFAIIEPWIPKLS